MRQRLLGLVGGFFLLGGLFLQGCGTPLQEKEIRQIDLRLWAGSTLVNNTGGALALDQSYKVAVQITTTDGQLIKDPRYSDLIIESPNKSVSPEWKYSLIEGYKLHTTKDTAWMRNQSIELRIRVKNNSFRSRLYRFSVLWPKAVKHVFTGRPGASGSDGLDGLDGADQSLDNPPTDGENGENGADGLTGQKGPDLRVYSLKIREKVEGRFVEGILYKIREGQRPPVFHYARASKIDVHTIGGIGAGGGNGGNGGNGGSADRIDPDVTPIELHFDGALGGLGGHAGAGGLGGDGGRITFFHTQQSKTPFAFVSEGGLGGQAGIPGSGGAGGTGSYEELDAPDAEGGQNAPDGTSGRSERIGAVLLTKAEMIKEFSALGIKAELVVGP